MEDGPAPRRADSGEVMVVHVSHTYGTHGAGGADAAATRRHLEMRLAGIDSHFLCAEVDPAETLDDSVLLLPQGRMHRWLFRLCAWRLVRYAMRLFGLPMDATLGIVPVGLGRVLKKLKPERVYLHYLSREMLRYEELLSIRCPVVVVLHDLSMLSGRGCMVHSGLTSGDWLDRWLFGRKRRVLGKLDVSFEAPSEWAANECRNSEIGRGRNVVVRRGAIDRAFSRGRVCDETRDGVFRILFGCRNGRGNPAKGFQDLAAAIALLPDDAKRHCELLVFGEDDAECETGGVKTVFLGEVNDAGKLADIYRSCDVLAFPSLSETQGLVKDEALACGLKVITFNRTACPEGIRHKENGYIASDVQDFANGIVWAMKSCRE